MKVKKKFNDGKLYNGTASKYHKRQKRFKVKYEDNDIEDSTLTEFKKILIYTKDKPLKKPTTELRKKVV